MNLHVGTSGYSYKEWKGKFYPADLAAAKMLNYYSRHFNAVEINSTFRALPAPSVARKWAGEVEPDFKFALKAPQQITHISRLNDAQKSLQSLIDFTGELRSEMAPLLFQLPPNFKKNLPRLVDFLALLPARCQATFEFRHQSWFEDDVLDVLRDHQAPLCFSDEVEDLRIPFAATAGWGYLRLRRCVYEDAQLKQIWKKIRQQNWRDVFVFFKHEDKATGPRLAERFRELAR